MGSTGSAFAWGEAWAHGRDVAIAPLSDTQLMSATARGDARAYARIVERHLPAVYAHCRRLVQNRHDAEDLTQESFARLWLHAPRWRPVGGGLPAWLHRVATNLCVDRLRAHREPATGDLPEMADGAPDAVRHLGAGELARLLDLCLRRLPMAQREALLLRYYEGHSNAFAAQRMDMNIKAYESLLLRARRRMSLELDAMGVGVEDLDLLA